MKLYTEEQIRKSLNDNFNFGDRAIDFALSKMTPIELPSDEEIGVIALNVANTLEHKLNSQEEAFFLAGFQTCAKWVIEQIKQQDNEEQTND